MAVRYKYYERCEPNKMNNERKKRLQQRMMAGVGGHASVQPGATDLDAANLPQPTVTFTKFYLIELQADEDGEDCIAIYRTSDLLTVAGTDGETPAPVHVCYSPTDAAAIVAVLDQLVVRAEGADAVSHLDKVDEPTTTDATGVQ